ncbi:hypothetical protein ACI0X9_003271 [Cronobacter turicensis]
MITIDTKTFADLIGISESDLVKAMIWEGEVNGVKLPEPVKGHTGRTRRFSYEEAVKFAQEISDTSIKGCSIGPNDD